MPRVRGHPAAWSSWGHSIGHVPWGQHSVTPFGASRTSCFAITPWCDPFSPSYSLHRPLDGLYPGGCWQGTDNCAQPSFPLSARPLCPGPLQVPRQHPRQPRNCKRNHFYIHFLQKESSRTTLSMKTPGRKAAQSEISSQVHAGKHMESATEWPRSLTAPSE